VIRKPYAKGEHELNFEASSAGVKTPRSVMMPVMRSAGGNVEDGVEESHLRGI